MGYQFFHVEAYGRKAGKTKREGHSIRSIIAEADREPGNFDKKLLSHSPPSIFLAVRFLKSRPWLAAIDDKPMGEEARRARHPDLSNVVEEAQR